MNKEKAIKYLQQLYPNGGHCWLDEQRIEAIGIAISAIEFKEKVRAEIERRIEELQPCNTRENLRAHGAIAGYYQILSFIDSMQEEEIPPKFPVISQKKCMYTKDDFTDEDRKVLCDGCEEECEYAQKKEPANKDYENALNSVAVNFMEAQGITPNLYAEQIIRAVKFGAKWQKTKDESTTEDLGEYINKLSKRFPEVSFAKLSRIAVRVAKWQMAQMIKDATDVTVHVDAGGYPYILQLELYDYDKDVPLAKEGDKYKVVLIKEE